MNPSLPRRHRIRAPLALVLSATVTLTAGCGTLVDPPTKETTVAESTDERPYVSLTYQIPTNVASAPFRLIYLGSGDGKAAAFTIPDPPDGADGQPEKDFALDVGESHTVAGYTLRLLGTGNNVARIAVTDPQGVRVGN